MQQCYSPYQTSVSDMLVSTSFGSPIAARAYASGEYRYGMNGQEKDDELSGTYSAEYWQYDSRLARRWNVDPVIKSHESPFATFANNPIWFVDINGADTSFSKDQAGLETQKDFNDAIDELDEKIKTVENNIQALKELAENKNWSSKKYQKELTKKGYENELNNLKEVRAVFDEIIESPVTFHYSHSTFENAPRPQFGSTSATDPTGQNVYIKFVKGDKGALVHENRHGVGVLRGEIGYGNSAYDYADEYEAFRHQEIFMGRKAFQTFLRETEQHELQRKSNGGSGVNQNPNYSVEHAVKYIYGHIDAIDKTGNQVKVSPNSDDPYQKFLNSKR